MKEDTQQQNASSNEESVTAAAPIGKRECKPWLTACEQVEHLKSKGVRFVLISEGEAVDYLRRNSNYYRLRSYRTGFPKVQEGKRKGTYVNLDFKMLMDLSIVDMLLRKRLLPLAIDIEHFAKVGLLNQIEVRAEDGYAVVADFLSTNDGVKKEVSRGKSSVYVAGILDRYPDFDFPVWAFLEVISFGTFCHFYRFCAERFDDAEMKSRYYLLMEVKNFRNACAHNNCVLNDLSTDGPAKNVGRALSQAIASIPTIGKSQRRKKMRNVRLRQIATTLYMHQLIASPGVKGHTAEELSILTKRMNKHMDYYNGVDSVSSTFDFLTNIIERWYPFGGQESTPELESEGEVA